MDDDMMEEADSVQLDLGGENPMHVLSPLSKAKNIFPKDRNVTAGYILEVVEKIFNNLFDWGFLLEHLLDYATQPGNLDVMHEVAIMASGNTECNAEWRKADSACKQQRVKEYLRNEIIFNMKTNIIERVEAYAKKRGREAILEALRWESSPFEETEQARNRDPWKEDSPVMPHIRFSRRIQRMAEAGNEQSRNDFFKVLASPMQREENFLAVYKHKYVPGLVFGYDASCKPDRQSCLFGAPPKVMRGFLTRLELHMGEKRKNDINHKMGEDDVHIAWTEYITEDSNSFLTLEEGYYKLTGGSACIKKLGFESDGASTSDEGSGETKKPSKKRKHLTKKQAIANLSEIKTSYLLSHDYKPVPPENLLQFGDPCVLKYAVALASAKFVHHWNTYIHKPLDAALKFGPLCRTMAGLSELPDKERECLMEVHPIVTRELRAQFTSIFLGGENGIKNDGGNDPTEEKRGVLLATTVLLIQNHLSPDFRDAVLFDLDKRHTCRMKHSGDGTAHLRVAKWVENPSALTPYLTIGKDKMITSAPASKTERALQLIFSELNNTITDVINGELIKICELKKSYRHEHCLDPYFDGKPLERQHIKSRIGLKGDELDFYKQIRGSCEIYQREELEEVKLLPYVDIDTSVINISKSESYAGYHDDRDFNLITDDPENPKRLRRVGYLPNLFKEKRSRTSLKQVELYGERVKSNFTVTRQPVELPTGAGMIVGTSCLGFEGTFVDTTLQHSVKQANGRFKVLTSLSTDSNAAHLQMPTVQTTTQHIPIRAKCEDINKLNNSLLTVRDPTQHDEARTILSPAYRTMRATISMRSTCDPEPDKAHYISGALKSKMGPDVRRPNLYNEYDRLGVMTGVRVDNEAKPIRDWHLEDKKYWIEEDASGNDDLYKDLPVPAYRPPKLIEPRKWGIFNKEDCNLACPVLGRDNEGNYRVVNCTGIRKALHRIAIDGDKMIVAMHHATSVALAQNRKAIKFAGTQPDPIFLHPTLNMPFAGGSIVPAEESNIRMTRYKKESLYDMNRFMLSAWYKNLVLTIDTAAEVMSDIHSYVSSKMNEFNIEKMRADPEFQRLLALYGNLSITVGGSGGSTMKSGSNCSNSALTGTDPHFVIKNGQDIKQNNNQDLVQCGKYGNAICFFVHERWFRGRRDHSKVDKVRERMDVTEGEDEEELDDESDGDGEEGAEEDVAEDPGQRQKREKSELPKTGNAFVLGYFTIVRHTYKKLSFAELEEAYEHYPGYVGSHPDTTSHYIHGTYLFDAVPSLPFELLLQTIQDSMTNCAAAYETFIVDRAEDKLIDTTQLELVQKHVAENMPASERAAIDRINASSSKKQWAFIPPYMITARNIIDYRCSTCKNPENPECVAVEVLSLLKAKTSSKSSHKEELESQYYAIRNDDELLSMMANSVGVASERINPLISTRESSEGVESHPLVGKNAEGHDLSMYAEPTRVKGFPCAIRDGDCAPSFAAYQMDLYRMESARKGIALSQCTLKDKGVAYKDYNKSGRLSFLVTDWNEATCRLVASFLCMAFFLRQTGRIVAWEGVLEWRKQIEEELPKSDIPGFIDTRSDVCLPTETNYRFVEAYFRRRDPDNTRGLKDFFTKQHHGPVHESLKQKQLATQNICRALVKCYRPEGGAHTRIFQYLLRANGKVKRDVLRSIMAKGFSLCLNGDESCAKLLLILHQAIADVEGFLPGFAGEVTLLSVSCGYGSQFGLRTMFNIKSSFSDNSKYLQLLEKLHTRILDLLGKLSRTKLLCLGYVKTKDGKILSLFNGREYSYTDTEHWCCKLYLQTMMSHASRTISDSQNTSVHHAWPLPPHVRKGQQNGKHDGCNKNKYRDKNPRRFVLETAMVYKLINRALSTPEGRAMLANYPKNYLYSSHSVYIQ